MCAEGAINCALNGNADIAVGANPFYDMLHKVTGRESIYLWNDKPERTFSDIMDAFDAAIFLAKEQEANA